MSRPIVVFGDDWGRHVSSMQHIFRRIVADRPVIWVNAIGHRSPRLSRQDLARAREKIGRIVRPVPTPSSSDAPTEGPRPLAVIEPRVLPWHHWSAVMALNSWSLTRAIRGAITEHGLIDDPILVTGSPPSVGILGRLGEIGSVYFCMDDFLHLPGVSAHMIGPLERQLLERVDVVVATAARLVETKRPRSGRSYHLPQGVNHRHFGTPRPIPAELSKLPRPLIGFAGGVSDCMDPTLVSAVAERYSEGTIVMVGPLTGAPDLLRSLEHPNVHFLGAKPYTDLPAYVQAFDVGIIPYVLNDWTRGVDPLKLLEYLAAGIPVVTSHIPEAEKYHPVVRVADSAEAFVAEVADALQAGPDARQAGIDLAQENTWERRATQFLEILDALDPHLSTED